MWHVSRCKRRRIAGRTKQGRLHREAQHLKQGSARDEMVATSCRENKKSQTGRGELGAERNQSAHEDDQKRHLDGTRVTEQGSLSRLRCAGRYFFPHPS